jgi:hypothetical protein
MTTNNFLHIYYTMTRHVGLCAPQTWPELDQIKQVWFG